MLNQAERAKLITHYQQICKDCYYSWSKKTSSTSGKDYWVLKKNYQKSTYTFTSDYFPAVVPEYDYPDPYVTCTLSNCTPIGCALMTKLIGHTKVVKAISWNYIGVSAFLCGTIPDETEGHTNGDGIHCWVGTNLKKSPTAYKDGDKDGVVWRCSNPMPTWLAVAHELIHALHSLNGDAKTTDAGEEGATVSGSPANDSEPTITENGIRAEHPKHKPALPPRINGNCGAYNKRWK